MTWLDYVARIPPLMSLLLLVDPPLCAGCVLRSTYIACEFGVRIACGQHRRYYVRHYPVITEPRLIGIARYVELSLC